MQIFVTTNRGQVLTLEVERTQFVEAVREQLHQKAQLAGIPGGLRPSLQRLFFADPVDGRIHELRGRILQESAGMLTGMLLFSCRGKFLPMKVRQCRI